MTAFSRRMMLDTVLAAAAAGVFVRPAFAGSQVGAAARPRIIVFDVNETLLDVGALAPQFERIFGDRVVLQEWFTNVVLYSQTLTIAGPYTDFEGIARACLEITAQARLESWPCFPPNFVSSRPTPGTFLGRCALDTRPRSSLEKALFPLAARPDIVAADLN